MVSLTMGNSALPLADGPVRHVQLPGQLFLCKAKLLAPRGYQLSGLACVHSATPGCFAAHILSASAKTRNKRSVCPA